MQFAVMVRAKLSALQLSAKLHNLLSYRTEAMFRQIRTKDQKVYNSFYYTKHNSLGFDFTDEPGPVKRQLNVVIGLPHFKYRDRKSVV